MRERVYLVEVTVYDEDRSGQVAEAGLILGYGSVPAARAVHGIRLLSQALGS